MTSRLALIAVLLVAGCSSGTRSSPDGGGGTGGAGGAGGVAGSGGAGGAGNASRCPGRLNGSCRNNNDIECFDYTGLDASDATLLKQNCEADGIGTWTEGGACDPTGAVGGCLVDEGLACQLWWSFTGTAAAGMSQCAQDNGTWITP